MRLRVPVGKRYQVRGVTLKEGDEFDAPDQEGLLWVATRLAEKVAKETAPAASAASDVPFKRGPGRPRKVLIETEAGRYDRRDLRAINEDE